MRPHALFSQALVARTHARMHARTHAPTHTRQYVMRPKKTARHNVGILTGRKKTSFLHLCISVIPYPIGIKYAAEFPAS